MDTNDDGKGIIGSIRDHNGSHNSSQLDWKQSHTRFNYYEYDMLKCAPASDPWSLVVRSSNLDFLEHLEDSEHD